MEQVYPNLKWRWEGASGWGTHVNPWLIHVSVGQKPLQYCEVISLQLIKINGKKREMLKQKTLCHAHTGFGPLYALKMLSLNPFISLVKDRMWS